jgi:hypothetical protein
MFAHITRPVKVISTLAITQMLFGCGGGGGGEATAVVVDPKTKETAMEMRLASTLIEVNSMGSFYARTRIDTAFIESQWKATPVTTARNGCYQYQAANPDGIPNAGDTYSYNYNKCVFAYKDDANAMTQTATGQGELVLLTNRNLPLDAPWSYEDKLNTTSQLTFKLNLAGKLNFNGDRVDKGLQVQKATGFADGSVIELFLTTATSRETSDLGLSEVSISGNVSCKYATGIVVNGDCSASTGTLTGTIYGTSVNATMRQLAGSPETHEISYGDKKILIVVDKIDPVRNDLNQFTLKTSNGEIFALTIQETSKLRFY